MSTIEQKSQNSRSGGIPAITGTIDYSRAIHLFPPQLQPWRSTILAYGASFVSTTVGFPLDTVKTRMQTHKQFNSYFDCIVKTYAKEGIRGFFRGIWAPLISTSFSKSISVLLFTASKPVCYSMLFSSSDSTTHPFIQNIPVCFLSGMIAGSGVSIFACPFEFTKIYAQIVKLVQKSSVADIPITPGKVSSSLTTTQTIRQIVKHEGVRGLYSGFKYHFLRDSLSSGIYFSIYETLKWASNSVLNPGSQETSQFSILLAGGASGMLCWALIFPLDTTKSLVQKDAVTNILRKDHGLEPLPQKNRKLQKITTKLYRGLGISMSRSFIVNMIFFSTYEYLMAHVA